MAKITDTTIEALRSIIRNEPWRDHMAPLIAERMDTIKNNIAVAEHERIPEFKQHSIDRLGGMVQGLGWALNVWLPLIQQYDQARLLERAERAEHAASDVATGSPYAADGTDNA